MEEYILTSPTIQTQNRATMINLWALLWSSVNCRRPSTRAYWMIKNMEMRGSVCWRHLRTAPATSPTPRLILPCSGCPLCLNLLLRACQIQLRLSGHVPAMFLLSTGPRLRPTRKRHALLCHHHPAWHRARCCMHFRKPGPPSTFLSGQLLVVYWATFRLLAWSQQAHLRLQFDIAATCVHSKQARRRL